MIPLVRMHDLSVRELSVRLGGSKTGLLNASMVCQDTYLCLQVIALRKCELRVVQSSLIGAMLSKLLLILGMCFFAGGMRFTTQGFDSTATQVHSSLLSLSVGAVLLPAAFHFTLSNASGDKTTDIAEQKQDILEMSHGVSIVLIFIYIAYLFFQFWSHSHHFEDVIPPSSKLPNAVSMRSMASKVRPTSPMLRKLASPGATFATVFRSPRAPFAANQAAPPTYVYSQAPLASPPRNGILMNSPAPTAPQMMEAPSEGESPYIAKDGATSTVRLVTEAERAEFAAERFEAGMPHSMARDSMVSDLKPQLSWFLTLSMLVIVTVLVAVNAEWMIDSIDSLSPAISKEWIALILLPTVGSLAECITAINVSVEDQLSLSISVAVGSTIQTALFVIPFMVLLGWVLDKPLALLFDPFESIVLYISVNTMSYVVADGQSNWLEGLILIGLYVVAAVTFWFYPGSNFSSTLAVCST
ncbi:hypothetical protein BDW22DRAFT_1394818 [Trametopsis cervina]|nr:hypothetical protein BDW22DRAFT_1394818 [Trametopsis cervina]